ncbi:MAG: hypothetical protein AAGH67_09380 [Cyanobacteria bacterium P01_H01_bin.162]
MGGCSGRSPLAWESLSLCPTRTPIALIETSSSVLMAHGLMDDDSLVLIA